MDPNAHPYYTTLPTHRALLVERYAAASPSAPAAAHEPAYLALTLPDPAALDAVAVLLSAEEVPGGD